MSNSSTPYDDSFRTLLTDCSRLVIPLVNEIFNENHDENARVELYQNEVFISNGDDRKRVTDSNFSIGNNCDRYHIECQSSSDGTIIVRIFEYATQIAKLTADNNGNRTYFNLPKSGILYLKSTKNTFDEHEITIVAPNGHELSYTVPAIKIQSYTLDEIFKRNLWFLIPFYFFNFDMDDMEISQEKIKEMQNVYRNLWHKLDDLVELGQLSEIEKCTIKAMCDKVANALTERYGNVRKGVEEVMGGQVLDYEAKKIAVNERIDAVVKMFSLNKLSEEEIRSCYPEQFEAGKAKYLSTLKEK